jgi:hypothetical membrane protein
MSEIQSRSSLRLILALCGVAAPIVFTIFVVAESMLRPGYSQISNYVSDLGVGSNAILQSVNFWITGILTVASAIGLRLGLSGDGWAPRAGPGLVGIGGIGLILAGFFPDAPDPYPGDVHLFAAFLFFLGVILAIFVTRSVQDANPNWSGYGKVSLMFGLAAVVAALLFVAMPTSYVGLFERVLIVPLFLWIGIMSWKQFTLFSSPADPS